MTRHEYLATGARLTALRGSELPQSKLDEETVAKIRRMHARKQLNRDFSAAGLAARFGVHVRTVEKALRKDSWCHVRENGK